MVEFSITEERLALLRLDVGEGLSPYRYAHILGVENAIVRLGTLYCASDLPLLRAAALLHDLTKEYPPHLHEELLLASGYAVTPTDRLSPKLYHAMTAPIVIRERFPDLANDTLLDAVRYHTTGRPQMGIHEMLLYLADYIEEYRTFPQCVALRDHFWDAKPELMDAEERMRHLISTLILSFDMTVKDLLEESAPISPDSILARNALIAKLHR